MRGGEKEIFIVKTLVQIVYRNILTSHPDSLGRARSVNPCSSGRTFARSDQLTRSVASQPSLPTGRFGPLNNVEDPAFLHALAGLRRWERLLSATQPLLSYKLSGPKANSPAVGADAVLGPAPSNGFLVGIKIGDYAYQSRPHGGANAGVNFACVEIEQRSRRTKSLCLDTE